MKKIVIVADSTADLLRLSLRLKKNFEIIWLTYHKEVYNEYNRLKFCKPVKEKIPDLDNLPEACNTGISYEKI